MCRQFREILQEGIANSLLPASATTEQVRQQLRQALPPQSSIVRPRKERQTFLLPAEQAGFIASAPLVCKYVDSFSMQSLSIQLLGNSPFMSG